MPTRTRRMMLIVASLCALVTAGGVYRFLSKTSTVEAKAPSESPVLVAKTDLSRGIVLSPEHLALVNQNADQIPPGTFNRMHPVLGRTLRIPIASGSPITEQSLASTESMLETRLAQGYRAVGVFVDARGGLQRYLEPGDRVDVVVTTEYAQGGSAAKVLLQDVEILDIPRREGSSTYEETSSWMSVILAVPPSDAERLALAMHVGTIQLLGRRTYDTRLFATSGVTRDTLLPEHESRATQAGESYRASYQSVEVIKGQSRTRERFSLGPESWIEPPSAETSETK